MDYSTISNKTNYTEVEELTNGELSERYYLLKKEYENVSQNYEVTKQELHDTRRSYQTALDVQRHLSAELESLQADEEKKKSDVNNRITSLQEEISQLREERTEIMERHATEIKKLEAQIKNLKEEVCLKTRESPPRLDNSELEEARSAVTSALSDAAAAKQALEEARLETASWRLKTEELIEEMGEVRAAAELRREEVKAANEREAVALADLAEARAMLHQFTDAQNSEPHATKGNSIFAEVEDKRQEMAKNLIQMKQTNSRLRRELANKQAELDTLLHEKQTIWEQQAGATAHYDRELIESYEERITQLEGACERQRRELSRWFDKLSDSAHPAWLPGVLDHLKRECEGLRAEVLSRGAAQLAGAALVRDLRRKLALAATHKHTPPRAHAATHTPPRAHAPTHTHTPPRAHAAANTALEGPVNVPLRKINVDDVKKKVSFN